MNPPNNLPFAPEEELSDEALESMAAPDPSQVLAPRPVSAAPTPTPVRPLPESMQQPAPMAMPRVEIQSMPEKAQEPEDMFADSAPARAPMRTPVMPTMAPIAPASGPSMAKVAVLSLVIIVLLGGAAFGVYKLMTAMSGDENDGLGQTPTTTTQTPTTQTPTTPIDTGTVTTTIDNGANEPVTLPPPVTVPPSGVNIPLPATSTPVVTPAPSTTSDLDTDNDGLKDPQEEELGLDPKNPDSDADGLTDGDENKIYGTNPLNKDTDKDTFIDGDEVKNGYNPRGAGKCTTPSCEVPKLNP